MFVSLSLPPFLTPSLSLQLQLCEGLDIVALVFTARVCKVWRKVCGAEALFVSLSLRYFLLSHIHVKALNGRSFSAACTFSIPYKLCVFPHILTETYCLTDYLFINCFTGVLERQCGAQKFFGGRVCVFLCVSLKRWRQVFLRL